jgi:hypothetical protein
MKKTTLLLLLIVITSNIFGNGGPIDGCAVYRTGDIVLINLPDIKLIKEDLKIKIEGDYSFVNVTYLIQNNSYSDSKITYGFPVDYIRNELQYEFEWQDEYLPKIEFFLDSKKMEIKHQVDYSILEEKSSTNDEFNLEVKRSWYVVDFEIKEGQKILLNVKYKIKNGFEDWATTKSFFPTFDDRHFIYDFKPAKNWDDGFVPELNTEIDIQDIISKGGKVNITGLSLNDSSGIYSASFKNFDFKHSPNLNISYSNNQKLSDFMSDFISEYRLKNDKIKAVNVSSTLSSKYSTKNMFDFDFNTAWAEGINGDGIGEKIEIELNKYPLVAICLINGYTKNADLYKSNNRIKKLKIDIEYVDYKDSTKLDIESNEVVLKDFEFQDVSKNNFGSIISVIGDYGEGYRQITKITLTVLDVYKGIKYTDTCISELLLLGYE